MGTSGLGSRDYSNYGRLRLAKKLEKQHCSLSVIPAENMVLDGTVAEATPKTNFLSYKFPETKIPMGLRPFVITSEAALKVRVRSGY